jgi:betaine-aldehyde dehydrogenase
MAYRVSEDGQSYIGGRYVRSTSGEHHDVVDPSTAELVATVELAGPAEVDLAVQAAKGAFPEWSSATPAARSAVLTELARVLADRAAEFAEVESRQAGKPIKLSTEFDVPGTVDNVAFFAGAARNLDGKAAGEYSGSHTSMIRREAVGVVGSIAPWNYPLQMAGWKILPAVAAGNTIVLKPAELTPLTSLLFAQACTDAGMPAGVVNVVTGRGSVAGQRLVGHPDVSMVSFTAPRRWGCQS